MRKLMYVVLLLGVVGSAAAQPHAFQVTKSTASQLVRGNFADGRVGDWILCNDKIVLVIADANPEQERSVFDVPASGVIIDACLRGAGEDTLYSFQAGMRAYKMTNVEPISEDGCAGLRFSKPSSAEDPLSVVHEYRLKQGERMALIDTIVRNEGTSDTLVPFKDRCRWVGMQEFPTGEHVYVSSFNTTGGCVYGILPLEGKINYIQAKGPVWGGQIEYTTTIGNKLVPGQALHLRRHFIVAADTSDLVAVVNGVRGMPSVPVTVSVKAPDTLPEPAYVALYGSDGSTLALLDKSGAADTALAPGTYTASVRWLGRNEVKREFAVEVGKPVRLEVQVPAASRITLRVTEHGWPTPCKITFVGRDGTSNPNLGPAHIAAGFLNNVYSANGKADVALPPGNYTVRITRGFEYDQVEHDVHLLPGESTRIDAELVRSVDTIGWIACDFHVHTAVASDSQTEALDRLINIAAEALDFVPATEHNILQGYDPLRIDMGLDRYFATCVSVECTGPDFHLNAFPLQPKPGAPSYGAPPHSTNPGTTAYRLRLWDQASDKVIQLNHPDMRKAFFDRNLDGVDDGGFSRLPTLIDTAEVFDADILNLSPTRTYVDASGNERTFDNRSYWWLQALKNGATFAAVATSDTHDLVWGAGHCRTFVKSPTDDPRKIRVADVVREVRSRHLLATNGPFMVVKANGKDAGDVVGPSVELHIKVQAPNWINVNRVQILVNGEAPPDLNFTRDAGSQGFSDGVVQFEKTIAVKLASDGFLVVVATEERVTNPNDEAKHGIYTAISAPIFVDANGDGYQVGER